MTSYGDPHAGEYDDGYRPSSGRAQVPPPADSYGYGDSYVDPGYYAAPTSPASGRASVPSAAGRASVPVAGGRAAVVSAPAGRASVRPAASPYADEDYEEKPRKSSPSSARKKKRARVQKWIIAGIGVLILLTGGGLIGGSYFYDHIPRPDELNLKNSTDVFAADGTSQLAKLGSEIRSEVKTSDLNEEAKRALIAGEDKNFYNHHGIDMWGIARAAWNNLTGGETQGASTITQQYARQAANDLEVSYARKLREAVMARKLEDDFDKETILGFYLNTVYFGRGAHGIGAAYNIYFNKPVEDIKNMTTEQAAVLGAVLKQPEGTDGYDPAISEARAKERWNYVLNNMVENKWLDPAKRAAMKYPDPTNKDAPQPGELQLPKENSGSAWGHTDRGTGFVINRVGEELEQKGVIKWLAENGMSNWKNAGLRIQTTIEPKVQAALEMQLNRDVPESTMSKQRPNIRGAGVAINPTNGRVVAYYGGGNNGTGVDFASAAAPHPPASSFKIYTLAAAIEAGVSIKSKWDPTALSTSRGDKINLTNANREGDQSCLTYCTLEEMTVKSYNVPFYNLATSIGPQKVMNLADRAGVKTIWNEGKSYDMNKAQLDGYVGFGQFPITVLAHATGTATIAAGGVYRKPHFIVKVERKNKKTGAWERIPLADEKADGQQVIPRPIADEVTSVLKKIAPPLGSGWAEAAAGKTGTWENGKKENGKHVYPNSNAHAWFTGYTAQLATAIWVGDEKENETPIKKPGTSDVFKSRDNLGSAEVKEWWRKYMVQVNKEMAYKATKLSNGTGGKIGSEDRGNGKSPTPVAPPPDCQLPLMCPTKPPGGGGGGGGPNPTGTPRP
ncbi:MAG TPA: transglycosylase domain-containing protein [Candidatus Limnocylindrales bacterium]